jgi:hypothetical protein
VPLHEGALAGSTCHQSLPPERKRTLVVKAARLCPPVLL